MGATTQPPGTMSVPDKNEYWASVLQRELRDSTTLLRGLLARLNTDLGQLALIDGDREIRKVDNWPIAGATRFVVGRRGHGGLFPLAAGVAQLIISADPSRVAGSIINAGAAAATLYLCDLPTQAAGLAIPQVFVPAAGAWDFLLSRSVWCGAVVAVAATGGTSLSVAVI